MNRLLSMHQVRDVLGLQGRSIQWVTRRLRAIAEARSTVPFQLFQLDGGPCGRWYTTEADLRRLVPELDTHEASDAEELRARVERLTAELEAIRRRVGKLDGGKAAA